MKMTIETKEWNKKGELESYNVYETISEKGEDGLMHHVSDKLTILKGREIIWADLLDGKDKEEH